METRINIRRVARLLCMALLAWSFGAAYAATSASGQGYGLYATASVAGSNLNTPLGDTGAQSAPPDFTVAQTVTNASATAGSALSIGAGVLSSATQSALAQNTVSATGSAEALNLSLVSGGLIPSSLLQVTADSVGAQAQLTCSGGVPVPSGSSVLTNLIVRSLGVNIPVPLNPAPNTVVGVSGVASITFNEQIATATSMTVNALHIRINVLGLIAADVVVGHAYSAMPNCQAAPGSVTISAPDINVANQTSVPVTGACTVGGGTVTISTTPAVTPVTATCGSNGTYSASVDASALPDGSVVVNAVQDAVSASTTVIKNTAAGSPTVTVTAAPIINAANQASYGALPPLTGTCSETGQPVSVRIGSIAVASSPTCTAGAWTALVATDVSSLTDGPVLVTASQTNVSGQGSGSMLTSKDTVAPVVVVTSAPPINAGNAASYGVGGTCTAGDGDVTVTVGTLSAVTAPCAADGTWSVSNLDASGMADGAGIVVTAVQTDAAGNTGTDTRTTVKDTTPPVVTVDAPANIDSSNEGSYTASGTCTAGDGNVTVTIGSLSASTACSGTGTWLVSGLNVSALPTGAVTISASQTDAAGNTGNGSAQATKTSAATTDTTPPVVSVTAPPIDGGNQNTYAPSGTCTVGDGDVTVVIGTAPNAVTVVAACDGAGNWTAPPSNVSALPAGPVIVTASQTDAAGLTGSVQVTTVKTSASTARPAIAPVPVGGWWAAWLLLLTGGMALRRRVGSQRG